MTGQFDTQLDDVLSAIDGGFLSAASVQGFLTGFGAGIEQLMLALIPHAKKYAVPPISKFYVGAVALGSSGAIYFGANFEFEGEALGATVHAEQAAVTNALSHGETGIELLAISAPPCGFCRQFLNELTTAGRLRIALPDRPVVPLQQLLPEAFGPVDLGVKAGLMSPQSHELTLMGNADDSLVAAALQAANKSYAPYTAAYAAVALKTNDGAVHTGWVAENAAFNPTMSPLQAALVNLVIRGGRSYEEIADAVLVELADSRARHEHAARAVLRTISRAGLRVVHAR